MITINLLKKFHGLRKKYHEEIHKNSKPSFPLLPLILIFISVFAMYMGFVMGKKVLFSYFERLDNAEINLEDIEYPVLTKREKEVATLSLDNEPLKLSQVDEPVKPSPPPPKKITAPEPLQPPIVSMERKQPLPRFAVRVAIMTIKNNAIRLEKRLTKMGYSTELNDKSIKLATYRLSYEKLTEHQFERVKRSFKEKKIPFNISVDGDKFNILSDETFVKSTLSSVNKNNMVRKISGIITKGGKKETKAYEVLAGRYPDKKSTEKAINALRKAGFKPISLRIKD